MKVVVDLPSHDEGIPVNYNDVFWVSDPGDSSYYTGQKIKRWEFALVKQCLRAADQQLVSVSPVPLEDSEASLILDEVGRILQERRLEAEKAAREQKRCADGLARFAERKKEFEEQGEETCTLAADLLHILRRRPDLIAPLEAAGWTTSRLTAIREFNWWG